MNVLRLISQLIGIETLRLTVYFLEGNVLLINWKDQNILILNA